MRPVHYAILDKRRPVLLLTPAEKLTVVSEVTVAPILSGLPGLLTQLAVGTAEGLEHLSTIRCESIQTIRRDFLSDRIGYLDDDREVELRDAIIRAFRLPPCYDD